MDASNHNTVMPNVLFREIHKNGCLKKYSSERRTGFPKRIEKVWSVFCVHDDTEAFLEFYPDNKAALGHKPELFVSLRQALHVSPSICGQAEEFEFAVTLPSQVIRLAAPSWDTMMEWVDTLRNKLRELRVLAPKENLYTKMPEPRHMLLPTRDPTSPLPLPPVGAVGILPGVENPQSQPVTSANSIVMEPRIEDRPLSQAERQINSATPQNIRRNDLMQNPTPSPSSSITEAEVLLTQLRTDSSPLPCSSRACQQDKAAKCISKRNQVPNAEVRSSPIVETENCSNVSCLNVSESHSSVVVVNNDTNLDIETVIQEDEKARRNSNSEIINRPGNLASASVSNNITVIEVPPPPSPHYEHLFVPEDVQVLSDARAKLERVNSTGLIPRVPSRPSRESDKRSALKVNSPRGREHKKNPALNQGIACNGSEEISSSSARIKDPVQKETPKAAVLNVGSSVSVISVQSPHFSTPVSNSPSDVYNHETVPPIPAAFQPAPSMGLEVRDIPLIGGHQRRRRRSSSGDAGPSQRIIGGADLIRMAPAEAPEAKIDAPRLTLRETQVSQLRREMDHPGGVRLPLRRKDCSGAIALVDVANSVWVAGWKQREHPMLYNALHIGDQLVSIGDVPVRTAAEAQRILKGPTGPAVELVVKRLPRGKVLTLQRPRGGGDVGLLPDPTSGGEVSVVPGGAAALSALPAFSPTMDGLSLTSWFITEINGRPLNLFCKPADVTTRLNSVGRELSILVQPSDFVKQLRKQLKNLRSYKDYLLQ